MTNGRFKNTVYAAVFLAVAGCKGNGYTETKKTTMDRMRARPALLEPAAAIREEHSKCVRHGNQLQAGDQFSYGLTWRAMYDIKVTRIQGDTVSADISFPVTSPAPAVNLVSYNFTFKDVALRRSGIEALAEISCDSPQTPPSQNHALEFFEDVRKEIAKVFSATGEFMNFIAFPNNALINARVVEERESSIVLENTQGQRLTLDRRVVMNMEFVGENAGFFSLPMKLLVDNENGVKTLKAVVDCSEGARTSMEIFRSEHATGPTSALDICKTR